ncbi:hypothetical protein TNCV_3472321 [Trichonephila clavipes]|nr:hypothetical protein TNCV_3472321 [Trichonephila clavipes]
MPADPQICDPYDMTGRIIDLTNLMPDRKFTPSGDKPFENGMNSIRFCVCSMWWAKLILRLETTRYFATRTQGGRVGQKFGRGLNRLVVRGLQRKLVKASTFTGISFYFQSSRRVRQAFLSTLTRNERSEEAMNGLDRGEESESYDLISKPSCQILSKALAMSRKSIPVASCLAKPL